MYYESTQSTHITKITAHIFLFCLIITFSCNTYSSKPIHSYANFILSIQGNWKGCAIITPVGPRPYDIRFVKDAAGFVNGMADPGPVSDHYWSYRLEDGVLWLRFLSTFKGNDQPTWLSAIDQKNNSVTFRSKRVRKLKVEVTLVGKQQNIEIFLYEKPHVSIRLLKATDDDHTKSVCENAVSGDDHKSLLTPDNARPLI